MEGRLTRTAFALAVAASLGAAGCSTDERNGLHGIPRTAVSPESAGGGSADAEEPIADGTLGAERVASGSSPADIDQAGAFPLFFRGVRVDPYLSDCELEDDLYANCL